MKLITYAYDNQTGVGAINEGHDIVPLTAIASDMLTLITLEESGLRQAREIAAQSTDSIPLEKVSLLAPIPVPRRNIMCLGRNYAAHAEESQRTMGEKLELPQFPVVFTKATTAVNGPFDDIPYDPNVSVQIDYEAELAVIIGNEGRNITAEDAMSHVYGYCVMNDISARDLQHQHKQFFKGKSLDGSAPLGPWIVTADEIADPHNLQITCSVNGELRQDSNTSLMIFDIVETIVQLSRGMTLLSGDIIATGTPSGVGFARTPPVFLKPGDEIVCHVQSIGTIRNRVSE